MAFEPEDEQNSALMNNYFKKCIESRDIVTYQNDGHNKLPLQEMVCIGLKENTYNIGLFFLTPSIKENFADHEIDMIRGYLLPVINSYLQYFSK